MEEIDDDLEEQREVQEQLEMIKVEDLMAENAQNTLFSREFIEKDEIEKQAMAARIKFQTQLAKDMNSIKN